MRIVIDMQGAQTESRFRGIGRYSLSLALAMARNAGEHEVWLMLNGAFLESILDIRRAFNGLIPQERIRVFNVPLPVAEHNPDNAWRARVAELIREHALQQLNPDIVLLTSLFEGFVDNAVTSVGAYASGLNTAVIFYDLIPYSDPKKYLSTRLQHESYHRKIDSLKNAGLLLSISESTRLEGIQILDLPESKVVNISTAVDESFRPCDYSDQQIQQLRQKYGISRNMVMYAPGGFDARKNFDGLINAYGLLPQPQRDGHQLVIVSKINDDQRFELKRLANQAGLNKNELILTGYVPDEDLVALYNLATLFVFPSKHEGFGLPVLEAMACGAPTLGSNTTSIPEVIGWEEALFDPNSSEAIAEKMRFALENENWRKQLREHGLQQAKKFSWDAIACSAIAALEGLHSGMAVQPKLIPDLSLRPKLAYVSPLPPERSGISDYSAELLPALAQFYDVEAIVAQQSVSDPWVNANIPIRNIEWFEKNADSYDRVLYHFGNSTFHSHMFGLLSRYPGIVILHDFFLSGVLAHEEITGAMPRIWLEALYHSHGYQAIQMRFANNAIDQLAIKYPVNLTVLQNALAVIVHSEYSKCLARQWYGEQAADNWTIVPLLRASATKLAIEEARSELKLHDEGFVVCSFGFLSPTKLNHRLLNAWLDSSLSKNDHCKLVFVGENHGGDYGEQLQKTIKQNGLENSVTITGWADTTTFRQYLAIADVGVQLRTLSRGETSAAVLDCMNYGLPTIVNANGSMADLPIDAVWMLPDEFTDSELVEALETLWQDNVLRKQLAARAQEVIETRHNPSACAENYALVIESAYQNEAEGMHALVKKIACSKNLPTNHNALGQIATSIAASVLPKPRLRQLLVDVSSIVRNDLKSGIERVVRAQLLELIKNPPNGFRVEPVYLTDHGGYWHYRYARSYASKILHIEPAGFIDEPIDISQDDIFYAPDFFPGGMIEAAQSGIYLQWKAAGISVNFLVHDLLPVLRAEFFPDGAETIHAAWLKTIAEFSTRLICISNAVADELCLWLETHPPVRNDKLLIDVLHHGADIVASAPSLGLPDNALIVLDRVNATPTFVMVGTIEPRKGHLQVLEAFDLLWEQGHKLNLVIVGKEGWTHLRNKQRRTIPKIMDKIHKQQESGKPLFWLDGISDEYLEKIYAASVCLIASSEGEGFGLPLIEAAQYKLPIIARDIPVFREVIGEHGYYFNGLEPQTLADAVKGWLVLQAENAIPQSINMPWLTWEQNARQLLALLLSN